MEHTKFKKLTSSFKYVRMFDPLLPVTVPVHTVTFNATAPHRTRHRREPQP